MVYTNTDHAPSLLSGRVRQTLAIAGLPDGCASTSTTDLLLSNTIQFCNLHTMKKKNAGLMNLGNYTGKNNLSCHQIL